MYYANYLKFAERARTEWLRDIGFNQSELDILFVVRKVDIEYLSPARLDDEILIETSLQNVKSASITMNQKFMVGEKVLADANILLVCINKDFKPTPISDEIKSKLET